MTCAQCENPGLKGLHTCFDAARNAQMRRMNEMSNYGQVGRVSTSYGRATPENAVEFLRERFRVLMLKMAEYERDKKELEQITKMLSALDGGSQ